MTSNVGTMDRAIRIVLGIILIGLGLGHVVTLAIAAYVVGALAQVTDVLRFCPAWSIFGINTCALKESENK